jgi:hypothetical protein
LFIDFSFVLEAQFSASGLRSATGTLVEAIYPLVVVNRVIRSEGVVAGAAVHKVLAAVAY